MPWDMRPVDTDFLDSAPYRCVQQAVVHTPPDRLFDAIAGDPAGWGDWFPGFDHSGHWLTEDPTGPGSRRAVRMAGLRYEETILAWIPGERFAFRVDRAVVPLAHALAEDYRIAPHPSGSTLEWTFAMEPRLVLRPTARFFDPVFGRLIKRLAANLDRHLVA